ncbi:MAG: inositol monophosphatase [bacterium]|nr:inositol monophosphatase [bacterium]
MTRTELKELTLFARELAIGAGGILRKGFNRALRVQYKGRIDPVTEYDLKAEQYITGKIERRYPHHAILAEEGSAVGETSDYLWVIDPLDGTVNFAHGFPVYCVSIALQYKGESVVGAVYDPERTELFWASKGAKAYMNGRTINVSTESKLERALLATGFAYDIATARKNNLGLFARMAKKAQGIRRPGSAAIDLCWLACGRIDGFWELKLHPWDTAAAKLIVEAAGGEISRLTGDPYTIFDPDLLASNGRVHQAMRKVLGRRK